MGSDVMGSRPDVDSDIDILDASSVAAAGVRGGSEVGGGSDVMGSDVMSPVLIPGCISKKHHLSDIF